MASWVTVAKRTPTFASSRQNIRSADALVAPSSSYQMSQYGFLFIISGKSDLVTVATAASPALRYRISGPFA